MISRASFTLMDSPSGTIIATSGCAPPSADAQPSQCPQPAAPVVHCSAAANARAAMDRPLPGGPVNSQACVIPPAVPPLSGDHGVASRAAACSCSTTRSWPTRPSKALTARTGTRVDAGSSCSSRARTCAKTSAAGASALTTT